MKSQINRMQLNKSCRLGDDLDCQYFEREYKTLSGKTVKQPNVLEEMWFDDKTLLVCVKYRDRDGSSRIRRFFPPEVHWFEDHQKGFTDPEK